MIGEIRKEDYTVNQDSISVTLLGTTKRDTVLQKIHDKTFVKIFGEIKRRIVKSDETK